MNRGKLANAMTVPNLHLNPAPPAAAAAPAKTGSRHAAVTHDLYSYRRYKHWMQNLRAPSDKS